MSTTFVRRGFSELLPRLIPNARSVAAIVALAAVPALAQTGTISGRVTERVSGEPLAGATINATRGGGGGAASTKSLADGAYRLTNLAAGTYIVSVTARIGL